MSDTLDDLMEKNLIEVFGQRTRMGAKGVPARSAVVR
jgi:hypothetical protein